MLELGLKFTLAYLLGSVIGALVVGALKGGVDIRSSGSGNAGGTNALRTQGKLFALWVMLIDVGKGLVAVIVLPPLTLPLIGAEAAVSREFVSYAVALAVIVGHVFPIWFDFRGGKGGATAAGLLCYFSPLLGVAVLTLWLATIFFTGYVGLATVGAAAGAAVYLGMFGAQDEQGFFVFATIVALLITYTHRANIARMLHGTESRFGRYFGL
jgi:glycerol-3-phosphate acyltransferase PlsY